MSQLLFKVISMGVVPPIQIKNDSQNSKLAIALKAQSVMHRLFASTIYLLTAALLFVVLALSPLVHSSHAAIDVYDFDSEQQEAQYRGLIEEFRCPKCQNQNLAGSDAPIAQDLKQKTYDLVKQGQTDAQIRSYMQERYGDFISYKPPVRPSTWLLWFFPPVLLVLALVGWFWRTQRQRYEVATVSAGEPTSAAQITGNASADSHTGHNAANANALSADEQATLNRLLNREGSQINKANNNNSNNTNNNTNKHTNNKHVNSNKQGNASSVSQINNADNAGNINNTEGALLDDTVINTQAVTSPNKTSKPQMPGKKDSL